MVVPALPVMLPVLLVGANHDYCQVAIPIETPGKMTQNISSVCAIVIHPRMGILFVVRIMNPFF